MPSYLVKEIYDLFLITWDKSNPDYIKIKIVTFFTVLEFLFILSTN